MLMAVSSLSPVMTHTLMPAAIMYAIVSGTCSYEKKQVSRRNGGTSVYVCCFCVYVWYMCLFCICVSVPVCVSVSMCLSLCLCFSVLLSLYLQTILDSSASDEIELALPLDSNLLQVLVLISADGNRRATVLSIESLTHRRRLSKPFSRRFFFSSLP